MAPTLDMRQLGELYRKDKLVVHTMPAHLIDKRPAHFSDATSLMCGSIMFFQGLQHHTGKHIPNAVARFGPDSDETLFATLHNLDAIFDTHAQLEQQKPEGKRGEPFVLFANSDIGNLLSRTNKQPPGNYLQCFWGECPPVQCERRRSFDFRGFCCARDSKEDPVMEAEDNAEWNEMRAVLSRDNMVGLMFIADPGDPDPGRHASAARRLLEQLGGGLEVAVFRLREAGGTQGDLLVAAEQQDVLPADEAGDAAAAGAQEKQAAGTKAGDTSPSSPQGCRLVSFWEFLQQQQQQQQQERHQQQ